LLHVLTAQEAVMAHVRTYPITEQQLRIARWRMLGLVALAWGTLAIMWIAGN
jgi:hypothetical protein